MKTLFFYYHCNKGCKVRYRANIVNEKFEELITSHITNEQTIDLFSVLMKNSLKGRNTIVRYDIEKLQKDIDKQRQRLKNAKAMVLDGEISADDYKEMKHEIESNLERLESDQTKIRNSLENYSVMVDDGLGVMKEIQKSYRTYDSVAKQRISILFIRKSSFLKIQDIELPKL